MVLLYKLREKKPQMNQEVEIMEIHYHVDLLTRVRISKQN